MRALVLASLLLASAGCSVFRDEPAPEAQARALLAKGRVAQAKGDFPAARELLEKAAALAPADPEPQRTLGSLYVKWGMRAQAILALKRAAELAPTDPGPRRELASLYLRVGEPASAADTLRKAVEVGGAEADADLLRLFATALLRSGRIDEAEAVAQRVDRLVPDDPSTQAVLAEILIAKRQEEAAVRLLDVAVAAHPDSARVRGMRAKYFYSRGKIKEALREFELASQAAPGDLEIGLVRARAMAGAGQIAQAAALMDELVAANPTDLDAQSSLAEVKLLAGDVAGARAVADAVIARQPRNGRALYVRARAIESQGTAELGKVLDAYRETLEADPDQTDALSRLWRIYLKQGQKTDAISALERLVILGDATPDEEVSLAGLYADTGLDPGRGLKLCEDALRRDPGNPKLLALKHQLEKARGEEKKRKGTGGVQVIRGGR